MNILLFTTTYLDLYKPVVDVLQNQGHTVSVIKDTDSLNIGDPKLRAGIQDKIRNRIKYRDWNERVRNYWLSQGDTLSKDYDMFICLNGTAIDKHIINMLKLNNPNMKEVVLYAWDDLSYWDFNLIRSSFDRAYTFDIVDSRKYAGWELLPPFYISPENKYGDKADEEYNLFMIGTNHDGRFVFINKVLQQLKTIGIDNNCVKLLREKRGNRYQLIKTILKALFPSYKLNMDFDLGKIPEYSLEKPIDIDEYNRLLNKSKIVFDDVRPGQSGLSPRFVWALANNKKVITTNKFADQYSFVNKESVMCIDRQNPKLLKRFFTDKTEKSEGNLETLELSNWVKILIGEVPVPKYDRHEYAE